MRTQTLWFHCMFTSELCVSWRRRRRRRHSYTIHTPLHTHIYVHMNLCAASNKAIVVELLISSSPPSSSDTSSISNCFYGCLEHNGRSKYVCVYLLQRGLFMIFFYSFFVLFCLALRAKKYIFNALKCSKQRWLESVSHIVSCVSLHKKRIKYTCKNLHFLFFCVLILCGGHNSLSGIYNSKLQCNVLFFLRRISDCK